MLSERSESGYVHPPPNTLARNVWLTADWNDPATVKFWTSIWKELPSPSSNPLSVEKKSASAKETLEPGCAAAIAWATCPARAAKNGTPFDSSQAMAVEPDPAQGS